MGALAAVLALAEIAIYTNGGWARLGEVIFTGINKAGRVGDIAAKPNGKFLRGALIGAVATRDHFRN